VRNLRVAFAASALLVLAPLTGCQIPADLINPDLITSLGFDVESISPSAGRIVVAFNNEASSPADFFIAVSDDPADPLSNVIGAPVTNVAAGETVNRVFDCPVGVITPGLPNAEGTTGTAAINVQTGAGIAVLYNGSTIVSGRDFRCGDVVEIRLVQTGDGAAAADYAIVVTIRAGR
jgi:hypothetical protein